MALRSVILSVPKDPNFQMDRFFQEDIHQKYTEEVPELYPPYGDCARSDAATPRSCDEIKQFPFDDFDFSYTHAMKLPAAFLDDDDDDEDSQAGLATDVQPEEDIRLALPQGTLHSEDSSSQTMAIVPGQKRKADVLEDSSASESEDAVSSASESASESDQEETPTAEARAPARYAWEPQAHRRVYVPAALRDTMCRVHGCMHVFNKLNSCYVHRDKHFGAAFVCPRQGCSAKYPWASQFKKHLRSKEKCDKFALSMSTPADWVPYVRNREDTWFKAGVITGKPYRPR